MFIRFNWVVLVFVWLLVCVYCDKNAKLETFQMSTNGTIIVNPVVKDDGYFFKAVYGGVERMRIKVDKEKPLNFQVMVFDNRGEYIESLNDSIPFVGNQSDFVDLKINAERRYYRVMMQKGVCKECLKIELEGKELEKVYRINYDVWDTWRAGPLYALLHVAAIVVLSFLVCQFVLFCSPCPLFVVATVVRAITKPNKNSKKYFDKLGVAALYKKSMWQNIKDRFSKVKEIKHLSGMIGASLVRMADYHAFCGWVFRLRKKRNRYPGFICWHSIVTIFLVFLTISSSLLIGNALNTIVVLRNRYLFRWDQACKDSWQCYNQQKNIKFTKSEVQLGKSIKYAADALWIVDHRLNCTDLVPRFHYCKLDSSDDYDKRKLCSLTSDETLYYLHPKRGFHCVDQTPFWNDGFEIFSSIFRIVFGFLVSKLFFEIGLKLLDSIKQGVSKDKEKKKQSKRTETIVLSIMISFVFVYFSFSVLLEGYLAYQRYFFSKRDWKSIIIKYVINTIITTLIGLLIPFLFSWISYVWSPQVPEDDQETQDEYLVDKELGYSYDYDENYTL